MDYRPLGRTGLEVSMLCLGTMTFGEQNSEADGHAQLDCARDHGINFVDTAELYSVPPRAQTQGSTERIVGSWLAARGGRDKMIIATKVCGSSEMNWFRDDGGPTRPDRSQIREAVHKSLKRLRTDYIDLYQVHWPDRPMPWGSNPTRWRLADTDAGDGETPIGETLAALGELVAEGKVRHIGVSNESAWGIMRYLAEAARTGLPRVASVQNAYSLLNRTFEVNLAELSLREDVGLLAYSPLGQGYLTGKYQRGARPPGARATLFNRGQRYETPGAEEAIEAYLGVARDAGLDPAQMALAFAASRPFMTAVILGATTLAQLSTNIGAAELAVTPELEARINAVHQRVGNPCP